MSQGEQAFKGKLLHLEGGTEQRCAYKQVIKY